MNTHIFKGRMASQQQSVPGFESFSDFWQTYVKLLQMSASKKRRGRAWAESEIGLRRGHLQGQPSSVFSLPRSRSLSNSEDEHMSKLSRLVNRFTGLSVLIAVFTWGFMAAMAFAWAFDDKPPFKMLDYTITSAPQGGTMLVFANVKRDLTRHCDATYSRRMVDSRKVIFTLEPDTTMSASAIGGMDLDDPDKLRFAVRVPYGVAPGPVEILTPLQYVCNPWHALRPITTTVRMRGEVLP